MKPTLKLNIPEGWHLDYELKEFTDNETGFSSEYEVYIITPDQSESISHVVIYRYLENATISPEEYLQDSAVEYLNSLVIPDSLRPSLDDFLYHYNIGGFDACCCIFQEPGEAEAEVKVVWELSDEQIVDATVHILDYADGAGEVDALDFINSLFGN